MSKKYIVAAFAVGVVCSAVFAVNVRIPGPVARDIANVLQLSRSQMTQLSQLGSQQCGRLQGREQVRCEAFYAAKIDKIRRYLKQIVVLNSQAVRQQNMGKAYELTATVKDLRKLLAKRQQVLRLESFK